MTHQSSSPSILLRLSDDPYTIVWAGSPLGLRGKGGSKRGPPHTCARACVAALSFSMTSLSKSSHACVSHGPSREGGVKSCFASVQWECLPPPRPGTSEGRSPHHHDVSPHPWEVNETPQGPTRTGLGGRPPSPEPNKPPQSTLDSSGESWNWLEISLTPAHSTRSAWPHNCARGISGLGQNL